MKGQGAEETAEARQPGSFYTIAVPLAAGVVRKGVSEFDRQGHTQKRSSDRSKPLDWTYPTGLVPLGGIVGATPMISPALCAIYPPRAFTNRSSIAP